MSPQYLNPKRRPLTGIKRLLVNYLNTLGYKNFDYYYVHGEGSGNKLTLGKQVSVNDAVFNLNSGDISVGDFTTFGHSVSVLTGFHRFSDGKLARLTRGSLITEVPTSGFDINIGSGCYIGSHAIILKGVQIGDNAIIGAGAVVTKSIEPGGFVIGTAAHKFMKEF